MKNQWRVMSEYCREQHPLLCEDASEEEHFSPRYYPRVRPALIKGRNRNNLRGATAILAKWPDHWASFLTYWWIGIGMASVTTFIIYNSLFAFSMVPLTKMNPARPKMFTENGKISNKNLPLPEVFMHVFVNQNEVVDINQYIPYVETISNTFLDYKFHFIIVVNDTNLHDVSAAENNEQALNMILNKDQNTLNKDSNKNINIEHITLSTYMDNSPLQKYWRTLPHQLIEFVARTVSIWEKGGVAFNPNILTPRFQHSLYIEKLQTILNKYAHTNKVVSRANISKINKSQKKHRKLNNIRDIIDAMENEDVSGGPYSQQKLSEAENIVIQSKIHENDLSITTDDVIKKSLLEIEAINEINSKIKKTNNVDSTTKYERVHIFNNTEPIPLDVNSTSTKMNLIPSFLEFLFHNRGEDVATNRTRKNAILPIPQQGNSSSKIDVIPKKNNLNINDPVIVSVVNVNNTSKVDTIIEPRNKQSHEELKTSRLTIDLKGNIIATITPCHAFLGTIFSNIVHHNNEETITDFIIAELSIFCKGLLTSCMGIDLILL